MGKLSSGTFADIYVGSALEIISMNGLMKLGDFDATILGEVSKKTGISEERVKYMHHAFHWSFFSDPSAPFHLHSTGAAGDDWRIISKNGLPKKTELVNYVLEKYGTWLEARFQNLTGINTPH